MWTMSQTAGSVSFTTFLAGFYVVKFLVFLHLMQITGLHVPLFDEFARQIAAGWILQPYVAGSWEKFIPHDSPWYFALLSLAGCLVIFVAVIRFLNRRNIVIAKI